MASGMSKRFGSNKLFAEFQNQPFIQIILNKTEQLPFARRIVVTRDKEVEILCTEQNIEVLYHDKAYRNEAIQLGIEQMRGMDACFFCPCDQPLLRVQSMQNLMATFEERGKGIFRLSYGEVEGAPVLFGKEYFAELSMLPEKCGGSYLARKYSEDVHLILAEHPDELRDIDTKEDYEWLKGENACLQ